MENKNLILELNGDKKYLVVEEITFKDKKYYYLVNLEDDDDYMFGEIEDNEFIKVEDKSLICSLLLQNNNN